jgi:hypothetical protein
MPRFTMRSKLELRGGFHQEVVAHDSFSIFKPHRHRAHGMLVGVTWDSKLFL